MSCQAILVRLSNRFHLITFPFLIDNHIFWAQHCILQAAVKAISRDSFGGNNRILLGQIISSDMNI